MSGIDLLQEIEVWGWNSHLPTEICFIPDGGEEKPVTVDSANEYCNGGMESQERISGRGEEVGGKFSAFKYGGCMLCELLLMEPVPTCPEQLQHSLKNGPVHFFGPGSGANSGKNMPLNQ